MLLQSQSGYIDVIPSLAPEWQNGEYTGLVAKGGFEVDCCWENGRAVYVSVKSRTDSKMRIKLEGDLIPDDAYVENGILTLEMKAGETVTFGKK